MSYIEQAIKDAGYSTDIPWQEIFYRPQAWQALGEARGWEDDYHTSGWRRKWHDFIDHLASGKDAEFFFKDL